MRKKIVKSFAVILIGFGLFFIYLFFLSFSKIETKWGISPFGDSSLHMDLHGKRAIYPLIVGFLLIIASIIILLFSKYTKNDKIPIWINWAIFYFGLFFILYTLIMVLTKSGGNIDQSVNPKVFSIIVYFYFLIPLINSIILLIASFGLISESKWGWWLVALYLLYIFCWHFSYIFIKLALGTDVIKLNNFEFLPYLLIILFILIFIKPEVNKWSDLSSKNMEELEKEFGISD